MNKKKGRRLLSKSGVFLYVIVFMVNNILIIFSKKKTSGTFVEYLVDIITIAGLFSYIVIMA
jgi:hypothetical protein